MEANCRMREFRSWPGKEEQRSFFNERTRIHLESRIQLMHVKKPCILKSHPLHDGGKAVTGGQPIAGPDHEPDR
jgi:hypothetical protein